VGSNDETEIVKILDGVVDPVGTFYRYSLPASLLHRRMDKPAGPA
jgi:F420-non-reducing hydrogenase small subunit